ncbi:SDR family NAD(P)-dependent oxidoreductase [Olivibacter jilunii]|uniref:SDR family NAD(P)-dependent oxidoreductase n=1 Tax=Olivibacter jilunii TaxID=985016 RepID=UPI001A914BB0|nr:SDR family NAD(P)-dependent oxidoreductase [Olivibacter jilunii]
MKVIVMTGATSGIGAEALKHLVDQADTLILIGVRVKNRTLPKGTEILPLDLASLKSVRQFADDVKKRIGVIPIDVLILNAGANFGNNTTPNIDGFEPTFGTNHLSHYLLARLLWENMSKHSELIFTTSDTHDPALFPFGPKTLDVNALAYPKNPKDSKGMKAYAASKLCNLLTAKYFAESDLIAKKGIRTIAYNPGATSGTALGGNQPAVAKFMMKVVFPPIMRFIGLFKSQFYVGSVKRAGEALAELALGKVVVPKGKFYASLVKGKIMFPNPSKLAQTTDAKETLWNESAGMVGLPVDI